jgi:hypothetical protein
VDQVAPAAAPGADVPSPAEAASGDTGEQESAEASVIG